MKRKPTAPLTKEDFAILTGKWEGRSLERPRLYPIGLVVGRGGGQGRMIGAARLIIWDGQR
jgi:hypothetical protein